MMPIAKHVTTIQLYDRQQTAVMLFAKLGDKYKWHQLLCHWALEVHEGLQGSNLALQPFAHERKKPRYHPEAVAKFIEDALARDGSLGSTKFASATFEIDVRALNPLVPWKLRRVQRCTKMSYTTARSEP